MDIEFIEVEHRENVMKLMEICGLDMKEAYELYIDCGYNFEVRILSLRPQSTEISIPHHKHLKIIRNTPNSIRLSCLILISLILYPYCKISTRKMTTTSTRSIKNLWQMGFLSIRSTQFASVKVFSKALVLISSFSTKIFQRRIGGSLQEITRKILRQASKPQRYSGKSQWGFGMVVEIEISSACDGSRFFTGTQGSCKTHILWLNVYLTGLKPTIQAIRYQCLRIRSGIGIKNFLQFLERSE